MIRSFKLKIAFSSVLLTTLLLAGFGLFFALRSFKKNSWKRMLAIQSVILGALGAAVYFAAAGAETIAYAVELVAPCSDAPWRRRVVLLNLRSLAHG